MSDTTLSEHAQLLLDGFRRDGLSRTEIVAMARDAEPCAAERANRTLRAARAHPGDRKHEVKHMRAWVLWRAISELAELE